MTKVMAVFILIGLVAAMLLVGLFDHKDVGTFLPTMLGILSSITAVFMVHDKVGKVQDATDKQTKDITVIKTQTNGAIKEQFDALHKKIDALTSTPSVAKTTPPPPPKIVKKEPVIGVDVSSYNLTHFETKGLSFAFVKASEGLHYVNTAPAPYGGVHDQSAWARSHGLVVGFYHFLSHGVDPVAQANHFASVVKGLVKPGDLLVCDWEEEGATQQERDLFMSTVMKLFPHNKVGLYCNKVFWFHVDTESYYGDFLWIAAPSDVAGKPKIKEHWTFHQYGEIHGMDANIANFPNKSALVAWTRSA